MWAFRLAAARSPSDPLGGDGGVNGYLVGIVGAHAGTLRALLSHDMLDLTWVDAEGLSMTVVAYDLCHLQSRGHGYGVMATAQRIL